MTGPVWSVANPTDGVLSDDDLELLRADPRCADQLAEAGLWVQVADNWLIADFSETQTTLKEVYAVGRYGLTPEWADGHDTGIYTFKLLRRAAGLD